ncbi:hypothetical protein ACO0SA_002415 [Hanseniaspora valbyensis]
MISRQIISIRNTKCLLNSLNNEYIHKRLLSLSAVTFVPSVKSNIKKDQRLNRIKIQNEPLTEEEKNFQPRLNFESHLMPNFHSFKSHQFTTIKKLLPIYKQCQLVIEVRDVRTPLSSKNIMFDLLGLEKINREKLEEQREDKKNFSEIDYIIQELNDKRLNGRYQLSNQIDETGRTSVRQVAVKKLIVYTFGDYLTKLQQSGIVSRKLVSQLKEKLNFYHTKMNENYIIINALDTKKASQDLKNILRYLYAESVKENDNLFSPLGYNCLILGIPNVGKSTVINLLKESLNKKLHLQISKPCKTGNYSGITKKISERIKIDDFWKGIYLYDTPGISLPSAMYTLEMKMALALNSEYVSAHGSSFKNLNANEFDEIMKLDYILYLINLMIPKNVIKNELQIPLTNDVWTLLEWYWQNILMVDINDGLAKRSSFEIDIKTNARTTYFLKDETNILMNAKHKDTKLDEYLNWYNIAHHFLYHYLNAFRGVSIPAYDINFWLGVNEKEDKDLEHFQKYSDGIMRTFLHKYPELQVELLEAPVQLKEKLRVNYDLKQLKEGKQKISEREITSLKTKRSKKKQTRYQRPYNKVLFES